ncbi:MAG: arylsulfatase [Planctomycetota bacterium]
MLRCAAPLLLVCAPAAMAPQQPPPRPNIVLVMTDDQGLGDFSAAGNPVLETPRLDAFAAQCPKVERFYVCPVCSPTRASLMTGRYHYRTRVVDTWIGRSMMEPAETTLAERLRAAGYRTGIFGKWHLGDCYPMRAIDQGFDEALVLRGGGLAQPADPIENGRRYTDPVLVHDGRLEPSEGYCTEVFFDGALRFVDAAAAAGQPFFVYLATNAPHDPLHDVPEDLLAKYRGKQMKPALRGGKQDDAQADRVARVFAMEEDIDRNFGRLLDHLDAKGLSDDTIVVFLCDNGPTPGRFVRDLRGHKGAVHEGGVRSPLFVRWPGRLSPETRVAHIAAHIDLVPTLCAAAGIPLPADAGIDGRDLLPLLRGADEDWPAREIVLQAHRGNAPIVGHNCAVIGDRWKLVRASGFSDAPAKDAHWALFDLSADPGERHDVAAANPEVTARLREVYGAWFADVSSTRADNYAPPRIRPGTVHEPETTLTHQDWRPADGQGWGHAGVYLLQFDDACRLDVTLLFLESRRVDEVVVRQNGVAVTLQVGATGAKLPIGEIAFAGGAVDLEIVCKAGDETFAPHQIVLARR